MADIWVISDTHFNHFNIVHKFNCRPFMTVHEMNEQLIENWNSVVKPKDKVYHLGDFAMGPRKDHGSFARQLNGRKRLVVGNHDDPKVLTPYFEKIMMWRKFDDWGMLLTHVPVHPSVLTEHRFNGPTMNIHGHIHDRTSPEGNYKCVSVEQIDYTPINIEDLKWKIGELK